MKKYKGILSIVISLFLSLTVVGCQSPKNSETTPDKSNEDTQEKNDFDNDKSTSDDKGAIYDDIKLKIQEIMGFEPVYEEIAPEEYLGVLQGRNLCKFVPDSSLISKVNNSGLTDKLNDMAFYYDLDEDTLYLEISYEDEMEVLLRFDEGNFYIVAGSSGVVAWSADELFAEDVLFMKGKIDETIIAYGGTGELLMNPDMDTHDYNNQFLSGVKVGFKDAYIFDSLNEKVIVFNLVNSAEIDPKIKTGYVGVRVKLIGIKDGVQKELQYYTRSDGAEASQFFFNSQRVKPFDTSNTVPCTDIAPMTLNIENETVLIFGLNWDGYDQYELIITDDDTGDVVSFIVDASVINKCSYEEYVEKRYNELSEGLNNSNKVEFEEYDITLNNIDISYGNKYISMTVKNTSTVPQSIEHFRVQAIDKNGKVCNFYSGNNTLIKNINPEEEVTLEWSNEIKIDENFTDTYILKVTMVAKDNMGDRWSYSTCRISN